jgi:ATP-GRASP peptide maturase of grasp-with-spasm system
MAIIQSSSDDRSTDDVIQWLEHKKYSKIKIFFDEIELENIDIYFDNNNLNFEINNTDITENFWYRRGKFAEQKKVVLDYPIEELIIANKKENIKPIIDFLSIGNSKNDNINSFKDNSVLKLKMLKYCLELKITIPKTLITNNTNDIIKRFNSDEKIIVKSIENPIIKVDYLNYCVIFDPVIKILSFNELTSKKHFKTQPSLFQEYIEKQFEIRTFYLNGKFKSMAIFSQQNEKTKEDFRNYDYSKPNRNVPFQLPKNIEKKLHKLMIKLNLNCGSFDIIYTPDGKYYFLEVNPIGQFQWLSQNCNYFLERMIAETLIN